jgi:excisionase family DNA binding protein
MGPGDDQLRDQQRAARLRGPRGSAPWQPSQSDRRAYSETWLTASDVLTVGEVAELFHVPESTVGDWARRQVIPSLKLGRRRIFIRSKIEAMLLADPSDATG